MATIKTHPLYPFVQIGLSTDFEAGLVSERDPFTHPTDWEVRYDGPGECSTVFSSEAEALAAVEHNLFNKANEKLVEYHLKQAMETGDLPLLVRLAEGRGRMQGYLQAKEEVAHALSKAHRLVSDALFPFDWSH